MVKDSHIPAKIHTTLHRLTHAVKDSHKQSQIHTHTVIDSHSRRFTQHWINSIKHTAKELHNTAIDSPNTT